MLSPPVRWIARRAAPARRRWAQAALLGALAFLLVAPGCGSKKKAPEQVKPPAELYREAEAFMAVGKYGKAIRRYEQIDTVRAPDLRTQVPLRLADAYFGQKHILALAEAQSRYQAFLNSFPLSDQAPYAQYRYALCLRRQINKPERDQTPTYRTIAEFKKIEKLYPNSSWVVEAEERIQELEDQLTRDSLLKARFYYSRRGYVSAISRLEEILATNPDYAGLDDVLFYLGMALYETGGKERGSAYLQRVLDEYPDSRHRKSAAKALSGPGS